MARLILDARDARKDKFIPLDIAQQLYAKGELFAVELGSAYPNSYQPRNAVPALKE